MIIETGGIEIITHLLLHEDNERIKLICLKIIQSLAFGIESSVKENCEMLDSLGVLKNLIEIIKNGGINEEIKSETIKTLQISSNNNPSIENKLLQIIFPLLCNWNRAMIHNDLQQTSKTGENDDNNNNNNSSKEEGSSSTENRRKRDRAEDNISKPSFASDKGVLLQLFFLIHSWFVNQTNGGEKREAIMDDLVPGPMEDDSLPSIAGKGSTTLLSIELNYYELKSLYKLFFNPIFIQRQIQRKLVGIFEYLINNEYIFNHLILIFDINEFLLSNYRFISIPIQLLEKIIIHNTQLYNHIHQNSTIDITRKQEYNVRQIETNKIKIISQNIKGLLNIYYNPNNEYQIKERIVHLIHQLSNNNIKQINKIIGELYTYFDDKNTIKNCDTNTINFNNDRLKLMNDFLNELLNCSINEEFLEDDINEEGNENNYIIEYSIELVNYLFNSNQFNTENKDAIHIIDYLLNLLIDDVPTNPIPLEGEEVEKKDNSNSNTNNYSSNRSKELSSLLMIMNKSRAYRNEIFIRIKNELISLIDYKLGSISRNEREMENEENLEWKYNNDNNKNRYNDNSNGEGRNSSIDYKILYIYYLLYEIQIANKSINRIIRVRRRRKEGKGNNSSNNIKKKGGGGEDEEGRNMTMYEIVNILFECISVREFIELTKCMSVCNWRIIEELYLLIVKNVAPSSHSTIGLRNKIFNYMNDVILQLVDTRKSSITPSSSSSSSWRYNTSDSDEIKHHEYLLCISKIPSNLFIFIFKLFNSIYSICASCDYNQNDLLYLSSPFHSPSPSSWSSIYSSNSYSSMNSLLPSSSNYPPPPTTPALRNSVLLPTSSNENNINMKRTSSINTPMESLNERTYEEDNNILGINESIGKYYIQLILYSIYQIQIHMVDSNKHAQVVDRKIVDRKPNARKKEECGRSSHYLHEKLTRNQYEELFEQFVGNTENNNNNKKEEMIKREKERKEELEGEYFEEQLILFFSKYTDCRELYLDYLFNEIKNISTHSHSFANKCLKIIENLYFQLHKNEWSTPKFIEFLFFYFMDVFSSEGKYVDLSLLFEFTIERKEIDKKEGEMMNEGDHRVEYLLKEIVNSIKTILGDNVNAWNKIIQLVQEYCFTDNKEGKENNKYEGGGIYDELVFGSKEEEEEEEKKKKMVIIIIVMEIYNELYLQDTAIVEYIRKREFIESLYSCINCSNIMDLLKYSSQHPQYNSLFHPILLNFFYFTLPSIQCISFNLIFDIVSPFLHVVTHLHPNSPFYFVPFYLLSRLSPISPSVDGYSTNNSTITTKHPVLHHPDSSTTLSLCCQHSSPSLYSSTSPFSSSISKSNKIGRNPLKELFNAYANIIHVMLEDAGSMIGNLFVSYDNLRGVPVAAAPGEYYFSEFGDLLYPLILSSFSNIIRMNPSTLLSLPSSFIDIHLVCFFFILFPSLPLSIPVPSPFFCFLSPHSSYSLPFYFPPPFFCFQLFGQLSS